MSLVIDVIDLVTKHKSGELRCPATALINFCSWFFYGYQNKRNQHSNLFDNGHFCDFLVFVLFVVYFQNW